MHSSNAQVYYDDNRIHTTQSHNAVTDTTTLFNTKTSCVSPGSYNYNDLENYVLHTKSELPIWWTERIVNEVKEQINNIRIQREQYISLQLQEQQNSQFTIDSISDSNPVPSASSKNSLPTVTGMEWTQHIPGHTDRMAVIVEPRKHPMLGPILINFMAQLVPRGWGLMIIHGTDNEDYVRCITKGWKIVHYRNIGVGNLTGYTYSEYFTRIDFWEQIPAEHILIFQIDTFLRHPMMEQFLTYDYVGAPWSAQFIFPKTGGNGGLSLRRKSAMIRGCDLGKDKKLWIYPEDMFFSNTNLYFPSRSISMSFAMESVFVSGFALDIPVGLHKTCIYIPRKYLEPLVHVITLFNTSELTILPSTIESNDHEAIVLSHDAGIRSEKSNGLL